VEPELIEDPLLTEVSDVELEVEALLGVLTEVSELEVELVLLSELVGDE